METGEGSSEKVGGPKERSGLTTALRCRNAGYSPKGKGSLERTAGKSIEPAVLQYSNPEKKGKDPPYQVGTRLFANRRRQPNQ